MKLYSVVRYGPNGHAIKFWNHTTSSWSTNLKITCLAEDKAVMEMIADREDGFVEVYNLEKEKPIVYREPRIDRNPIG